VIGVLCKVIHHLYYQITGLIAETKEVIGITSEQIRTSNTLMVEVKDAMLLCPKKEVKKEEQ